MPLNKLANLDPNESLKTIRSNFNSMDDIEAVNRKLVADEEHSRYLWKYRDDSAFTESIFKDHAFWFSNPQSFNDPFDCNLSEVSSYSKEAIAQFLNENLSKVALAKYKAYPENLTDEDVKESLASAKDKTFANVGILCLSKKNDSMLMWSHYTNSHKGLVIELDPTQDLFLFQVYFSINYVDSYEPTNFLISPRLCVDQVVSTKSRCWAYEEEVRVMSAKHRGKIKFNPKIIKRVIFGCKSEADFIARIRALCSTPELQHVTFAQKKLAYAKFALELCDLKA